MRSFLKLYLKDYIAKVLACGLFAVLKIASLLLGLFSIFHGLLVYPAIGFCAIGIFMVLMEPVINVLMLAGFIAFGLFFLTYRYFEPYLMGFVQGICEDLKLYLMRPVRLKNRVNFNF